MGKIRFLVTLLLAIMAITACTPPEPEIPATETIIENTPTPSPLVINGTIHPGEWEEAAHFTTSDGSDIYLLQEGDILYLAVDGSTTKTLGGNIFLAQGDLVRIMHISAALGTAEYVREGASWSLVRNFEWKHRLSDNSEAALAERQAYLEEEGWAGPNANTGIPNHLELQIKLGTEPTQMAISLFRSYSNNRPVWPDEINDDTGETFSDGLPTSLYLEPETWYQVP